MSLHSANTKKCNLSSTSLSTRLFSKSYLDGTDQSSPTKAKKRVHSAVSESNFNYAQECVWNDYEKISISFHGEDILPDKTDLQAVA